MSKALPGWREARFIELFDIKGGSQPPKSEFVSSPRPGYIRLLQIRDFESDEKAVYIPKAPKWPTCTEKDIMIGRYGASVGKVLGGKSGAYNVALVRVLIEEKYVDRSWARHFFKSDGFQAPIAQISRSAQNGFNKEDLRSINVLLPPLEMQRLIATKLGGLLGRSKNARDEIAHIPKLVRRCKEAVLAAAYSGKLTREWRKLKRLASPEQTTIGSVSTTISYGSSAKSSAEGDIPVLRMGNIQDGKLDWTDLVYTSSLAEIKKYRLIPGDVLFNRTNSPELVGKTALYQGEQEAIYAGYLIRVRCNPDVLPPYLVHCLNSPAGRAYCRNVKTDGVSQSNINAKKLSAFEFRLPSLAEQQEIIRRITDTFEWLDNVISNVDKTNSLLDRLDQAVLAKAFRGELVFSDAKDTLQPLAAAQ